MEKCRDERLMRSSVFKEEERAEFLTNIKEDLNAFLWTRLPPMTTLLAAEDLCCDLFKTIADWYDKQEKEG